jgi:hypothetical protein
MWKKEEKQEEKKSIRTCIILLGLEHVEAVSPVVNSDL